MGGDDLSQSDEEPWDDVVEIGSSRRGLRLPSWVRPGWVRPGWVRPGWVRPGWVLLGLVVLVVTVGVMTIDSERAPSESSTGSSTPSVPPSAASTPSDDSRPSSASPTRTPAVVVDEVGRRLLGVTADWELFLRGSDEVIRIELARGRITTTQLPELMSSGPELFLVGPDRALVSPLDAVPGYVVPDGKPAREGPSVLRDGGPAFAGPDPGQVWVGNGPQDESLTLVDLDGREAGVTVPMPWRGFSSATSDGRGYLLVSGPGGVYQARPDGLRRITTGEVLAVGPTQWLTMECDDRARCSSVVVDRSSGARHVLGRSATGLSVPRGVISPDGSTAALFRAAPTGRTTLHLLDLASGDDRALDVPVHEHGQSHSSGVAWSPDGRWLFVPSAAGSLLVVDADTGRVREFGVTLPDVSQVVVRSSAR